MSALVHIEQLAHAWAPKGPVVFRIRRLTISAGESVFIHGPSGCGKSTLLSLLCGVLQARSGQIQVMGRDWAAMRPAQRDAWRADHIGYIFQQFNLLPYLSPLDNVLLACRFSERRRSAAERLGGVQAQAQSWLQRMHLPEDCWHRPSLQLSVGQQQRVAAARALMGQPSLLVADEPTSALDEATRDAFMATLMQASQDSGCAVVFVSHDLRLAPHFSRTLAWADLVEVPA
jgi:putative ABC transport system ATP-binding protein